MIPDTVGSFKRLFETAVVKTRELNEGGLIEYPLTTISHLNGLKMSSPS